MINRRGESNLLADILHTYYLRIRGSEAGAKANLSYAETKRYISHLHNGGFLLKARLAKGSRRAYVPTEKGNKLLKLLEILEDFAGEGLQIDIKAPTSNQPAKAPMSCTAEPFKTLVETVVPRNPGSPGGGKVA